MAQEKKTLARPVTVAGRTYMPGDDIPDKVAAQIRNPKAWAQGSAPAPAEPPEGETAADTGEGKQAKKAPAKKP